MRWAVSFVALWGFCGTSAGPLVAGEVGLVRGLLKGETTKDELNATDSGGSSTTELGARLGFYWKNDWDVLIGALVSTKAFKAADGSSAPGNKTSTTISAGLRKYVPTQASNLSPFGTVSLDYAKLNNGASGPFGSSETATNGVFYGLDVGLRALFAEVWWVDVTVPLFKSAATATTTITEKKPDGTVTKKTKTTRQEFYAGSEGALTSATVAVGRKF